MLDAKEAFSGFSSASVIVIGVLFVVVAGLTHTGVLQWIVKNLLGQPRSYRNAVVRLVLSCTEKRAKKDAHNRKRGLARLEKKVAKGKLTKQHINNRGYNKYLKMEGEVSISIDMAKRNHGVGSTDHF